jgi:ParB family chromosome partitioning protein
VDPNPDQPRKEFDPDKLQELSDSIRQHGVLQPLVVRPKGDHFELIAGERRFEASKRAGLVSVPALIRDCSDSVSLELAIVENVQREDITPLEAALAYRRLIDEFQCSQ